MRRSMLFSRTTFSTILSALCISAALPLVAEDLSWDDDSLFMDDGIEEIQESEIPSTLILFEDEFRIGGNIWSSAVAVWAWNEFPADLEKLYSGASHSLIPMLSSDVYLNARPHNDLRIFAKVRSSYPFSSPIEIQELFSDVSFKDSIFFRIGKQNIQWGSGYFWSPADILSLVPIDLDRPEAEREGPLSIKVSVPVQQHHLDLYVIGNDSVQVIGDVGIAGRAVIYLVPVELTIGTAYQQEKPWKVISAVSMPIGDFLGFAEGSLSFGHELNRYIPLNGGQSFKFEEDESLNFSGTTGFRWTPGKSNFALVGQYLFHGTGYSKDTLSQFFTSMAVAATESSTLPVDAAGKLLAQAPAMLRLFGQHHSMLVFSVHELFHDSLSANIQWQAAWTDLSGLVSMNLGWEWFNGFRLSGSLHHAYGAVGTEFGGYHNAGDSTFRNPFGRMAAVLELRIGGGRF